MNRRIHESFNRESLDSGIGRLPNPESRLVWHGLCGVTGVMAHKIEELPIHGKVVEFWSAVNALLETPRLRNNRDLHVQISRANDSIPSNMVEGFEQGTDRAFANYLTHSKASLAEVVRRLKQAYFKRVITSEELNSIVALGEPLGKMLGGFIKYLRRTDWTDRGSHNASLE